MWNTILMGLRNLRRQLARTILTLCALATGSFLLVFVVGLNEGTYADMTEMATSTWNGQLQVLHADYHESPSMFEAVEDPAPIMAKLEADPDVLGVSARIEAAGLFSVGNRTTGGALTGVIPGREEKVSTLANTVKEGSFLGKTKDPEALPIVIGDGLARRLEVSVGGEVIYMGQAADGSTAAEAFEVVGLIDSGIDEMDASMALIRLEDAQELFVLNKRVHSVVARTTSAYTVDKIKKRVDVPEPLVLSTWEELMPEVATGIEEDRKGGSILVFVIMLMVMLGTVNTLMMSVFERTKEFGVMKALGTPRWQIVSMIVWEGVWMAVLGVGLGVVLAALLTTYLHGVGVQLSDQPFEFGGMSISTIHPANTMLGTVIYPSILVIASILGAIWPAWRASNLDPVAALREL